ncbi:MAG: hypothetical protein K0R09_1036 [Clostridiales bacterium]|jgi:hypothetical protein|nr:hypothetical protein [Clostridiales bacterium]
MYYVGLIRNLKFYKVNIILFVNKLHVVSLAVYSEKQLVDVPLVGHQAFVLLRKAL